MIDVAMVTEDGTVQVSVDTDENEADETASLAGLVLEDILDQASRTAIDTWLKIHRPDEAGE